MSNDANQVKLRLFLNLFEGDTKRLAHIDFKFARNLSLFEGHEVMSKPCEQRRRACTGSKLGLKTPKISGFPEIQASQVPKISVSE